MDPVTESYDDLFEPKKEYRENSHAHPYNREEWLAGKKQERAEAFALLEEATEAVATDPNAFANYLDTQATLERYSVSNCLLISHQYPNVLQVADYNTWKEQGITVNKGEKGIITLEPGNRYTREDGTTGVSMNVKKVFDINQTSAAENGADTKSYEIRNILKALMAESPVDLRITDSLPKTTDSTFSEKDNAIYLRKGMDGESIFRAMALEIILAKMDIKGEKNERVAKAATFMLCHRFCIHEPKINFLEYERYFERNPPKEIRTELDKMRTLANDLSLPMLRTLERPEKQRYDGAR